MADCNLSSFSIILWLKITVDKNSQINTTVSFLFKTHTHLTKTEMAADLKVGLDVPSGLVVTAFASEVTDWRSIQAMVQIFAL